MPGKSTIGGVSGEKPVTNRPCQDPGQDAFEENPNADESFSPILMQYQQRDHKCHNQCEPSKACQTSHAARTSPALREGVIRQPRMPSKAAFRPKSKALTHRTACNGSIPNNPKKARTAENDGGKCVTGWSD